MLERFQLLCGIESTGIHSGSLESGLRIVQISASCWLLLAV